MIIKGNRVVWLKMLLSISSLLFGVLILFSVSIYQYFNGVLKNEIDQHNRDVLAQMNRTVDTYVIKGIENLFVEKIALLSQENLLQRFFTEKHLQTTEKLSIYRALQALKTSNELICDVSVYSRISNTIISTSGIKYLDDLKNETPINKDWIGAALNSSLYKFWMDTRNIYQPNILSGNTDVITYLQVYPFISTVEKRKGIFSVNVDEGKLQTMISAILPINASQSEILILASNGKMISSPDKTLFSKDLSQTPYVKRILESEDAGFFIDTINGSATAVNFSLPASNGWRYVVLSPYDSAYYRKDIMRIFIAYVGTIILLLSIFLAFLFSKSFYKPLKNLVGVCRKLLNETGVQNNCAKLNEYGILDEAFSNLSVNIDNLSHMIEGNKLVIKRSFFNTLITDDIEEKLLFEKANSLQQLKISFPYRQFNVLLIQPERVKSCGDPDGRPDGADHNRLLISCVSCVEEHFKMPGCLHYGFVSYNEEAVIVLNFDEMSEAEEMELTAGLADLLALELNMAVHIGLGGGTMDLNLLHSSYQQAKTALDYWFVDNTMSIFIYSAISKLNKDSSQSQFDFRFVDELQSDIKSGNWLKMDDTIDQITRNLQSTCHSKDSRQQVILFIASSLIKISFDLGYKAGILFGEDIILQFGQVESLNEFHVLFRECCRKVMNFLMKEKMEKHSEIVRNTIQYLKENIQKDVTLVLAASRLNISSSTLSRIFKQETGIKFIDYCQHLKMEWARELLLSSDCYSIEDVAEKSGYNQTQYFIKKFKEKYGLTPKQYQMKNFTKGGPLVQS